MPSEVIGEVPGLTETDIPSEVIRSPDGGGEEVKKAETTESEEESFHESELATGVGSSTVEGFRRSVTQSGIFD